MCAAVSRRVVHRVNIQSANANAAPVITTKNQRLPAPSPNTAPGFSTSLSSSTPGATTTTGGGSGSRYSRF